MAIQDSNKENKTITPITKPTILVVDDEEDLLLSLQRPLQTKYKVLTTTHSLDVMNLLCTEKIEGVLLDIRMPGMTGIELLKEIKFMYPHLPVLIMTGHGDENDTITTLKYGASGYIKKPIDLYALFAELERVLDPKLHIENAQQQPKILLVDDEKEFGLSIQRALKNYPYDISLSTSAEEALSIIQTSDQNFEIIVVDIQLPNMSGLDFIKNIMATHPDFIPIVITGNSSQELAIEALKQGIFDYIRKPFDIKDFVSAIERSIHKLAINREIYQKNRELTAKEATLQKLNDEIVTQKNYLENIVKSISNMLVVTDDKGKITTLNDAIVDVLGYTTEELIGQNFHTLIAMKNFNKVIKQLAQDKNISSMETEYIKKDKSKLFVLFSGSAISNRSGVVEGFVFIAQDISGQKEAEKELFRLSYSDSLTGLPNRLRFEMLAKEALASARTNNVCMAFLYMDLDGFKAVNDRLGHPIGDSVLKEVARRLQPSFRDNDFIARLGGDEFVICLYKISNKSDAGIIAQRILSIINRPFYIENNEISIGASIGIAIFPETGSDFNQMFKNSDIALYKAKHAGRNQYQYFTKQLDLEYGKQLGLENALRFALGRDEFYMVYQPIYDLQTNEMIAVEPLIRWMHPEYGPVGPQIFIPIAEYAGLIKPIGEWIINEVFRQFADWQKSQQIKFKLSLNISTCQLDKDDYLPTLLQKTCMQYNITSDLIELELTETAIMQNASMAEKILVNLNNKGFQITIDDFGQGYSSLSLLSRLPVSTLKIDKQFVNDISSTKNEFIVKSIISLAKSLSFKVIAEGIETKEQLNYLISIGCDYGQGFYLCEPHKPDELLTYIQAGNKELPNET